MLKAAVIILMSVFAILPCADGDDGNLPAVSGDYRTIRTLDGLIYDLDWAGSKIVVRWLDEVSNTFHEEVINVPDDAKMRKGSDSIEFSEVEINDNVTVRYYQDADGTNTLISLEITSP